MLWLLIAAGVGLGVAWKVIDYIASLLVAYAFVENVLHLLDVDKYWTAGAGERRDEAIDDGEQRWSNAPTYEVGDVVGMENGPVEITRHLQGDNK